MVSNSGAFKYGTGTPNAVRLFYGKSNRSLRKERFPSRQRGGFSSLCDKFCWKINFFGLT